MIDLILIVILAVIIGSAVAYIVKAKKQGVKCIGCPDAEHCAQKTKEAASECNGGGGCSGCSGNCSCCGHTDIK